ncbi:MAG: DUF3795 domain-containing protein [Methanomassiliicoccaceae archaeon]|jgi:hypothetical protein|nr:DUF3795 domain-containing protein [Methanomassiliicoccaceae archaeon]
MDERYICYCGLYCENCAVKVRVQPAAKLLRDEMREAGFGDVIQFIPGGEGFWTFLEGMAEPGMCTSCRDGGGDPACAVRACAKKKEVELCAFCKFYPCGLFEEFFKNHPIVFADNALLREKGMAAWAKLQDERQAKGFVYTRDREQ